MKTPEAYALEKMHRRAQRAEGKLAKLEESIRIAASHSARLQDTEKRGHMYYLLGYMVSHIKPSRDICKKEMDGHLNGRGIK